MSETPTTTTPQKSIDIHLQFIFAMRLQFVSQCFRCPLRSEEREILSVLLPFVSQYASLVDVSDIFYFFCSGEGRRGCPNCRKGGVDFLVKIPGGGSRGRGGAGRVSVANWGIRGGGLNFFFAGPKCPPSLTFVPQCASHVYRSTSAKSWWFGHRDAPHSATLMWACIA